MVVGTMSQAPRQEDTLRELLTRVHERLRTAGSVDSESRALLVDVMDDIDRTLRADRQVSAQQHPPRLESLAVKFEAEHPALAQQLRQLADILVKVGI